MRRTIKNAGGTFEHISLEVHFSPTNDADLIPIVTRLAKDRRFSAVMKQALREFAKLPELKAALVNSNLTSHDPTEWQAD